MSSRHPPPGGKGPRDAHPQNHNSTKGAKGKSNRGKGNNSAPTSSSSGSAMFPSSAQNNTRSNNTIGGFNLGGGQAQQASASANAEGSSSLSAIFREFDSTTNEIDNLMENANRELHAARNINNNSYFNNYAEPAEGENANHSVEFDGANNNGVANNANQGQDNLANEASVQSTSLYSQLFGPSPTGSPADGSSAVQQSGAPVSNTESQIPKKPDGPSAAKSAEISRNPVAALIQSVKTKPVIIFFSIFRFLAVF